MRFLLLLHGDEAAELAMTPDERREVMLGHAGYAARLAEAGALIAGEPLEPSATGATVRFPSDGRRPRRGAALRSRGATQPGPGGGDPADRRDVRERGPGPVGRSEGRAGPRVEGSMLDTTTEAGAAAVRHLETELIVWLTTVRPDGQPQSSPVWFLWDGGEILVYSLAVTPRIRNIQANPRVSVNLNTDATASAFVTIEGEARIVPDAPLPSGVPAMIAKYRHLIEGSGWTVDGYAADYPTAIRIRPTRFRLG